MPYKGDPIDLWLMHGDWWVTSTSLTPVFDLGKSKGRPRTLRSGLRGIDTDEGQAQYKADMRLGVLRSDPDHLKFNREEWVETHPELEVGSAEMVFKILLLDEVVDDYMRRRDKEEHLTRAQDLASHARRYVALNGLGTLPAPTIRIPDDEGGPFTSEPVLSPSEPIHTVDELAVVLDRGETMYRDLATLLLRERDLLQRGIETLAVKVSSLEQTVEYLSDHVPQVPEPPKRRALSWRSEVTDWIKAHASYMVEHIRQHPALHTQYGDHWREVNNRLRARGADPLKAWPSLVYRGLWRWFFGGVGPVYRATGFNLYELNRIDKGERPSRKRTVFDYIESRDDVDVLKNTIRALAHETFVNKSEEHLDTMPQLWLLF